MKILDLFSGIGGFSLAGRWMGWETVQFVEIDKFCQAVLRKNFPNIPITSSIQMLAKAGLLPTPTCNLAPYQYSNGDKNRPVTPTLVGLANAGMLPTPIASDYKGAKKKRKGNTQLTETLGISSQLNPQFVEEMMGYPIGYTELSPSETALFRKSRSKSSKQSKK